MKQTRQTHNLQHHSAKSKTKKKKRKKKKRYGLLKLTNSCSTPQIIRHHSQTKSKKPMYIQLKITSKIRIFDIHEGHIMKKPRKSQCYISHNLVSSNHTSFIEGFPGTYGGHYSHAQHAYKHTFTHAYTPKYILKIVFLI